VEQNSIKELKEAYKSKKEAIGVRLNEFKSLSQKEHQKEFMFCLLTPQSQAKRCWEAVEQITKIPNPDETKIKEILKTKTRFHNNKTRYILESKTTWNNLQDHMKNISTKELRNWLAENVKGYGLKEASHFIRNIGKSNNEIAILDRHILKNLKEFKVIKDEKIKGKKDYFEKEAKFLEFAKSVNIPADELDLLFWSQENGKIFK
jgi:N-glycosylase/DNA lyase